MCVDIHIYYYEDLEIENGSNKKDEENSIACFYEPLHLVVY